MKLKCISIEHFPGDRKQGNDIRWASKIRTNSIQKMGIGGFITDIKNRRRIAQEKVM